MRAGRLELVGIAEAADILGVCRQRVSQLAERPDFPAVAAVVQRGRVRLWEESEIEEYARTRRTKPGRPGKGER